MWMKGDVLISPQHCCLSRSDLAQEAGLRPDRSVSARAIWSLPVEWITDLWWLGRIEQSCWMHSSQPSETRPPVRQRASDRACPRAGCRSKQAGVGYGPCGEAHSAYEAPARGSLWLRSASDNPDCPVRRPFIRGRSSYSPVSWMVMVCQATPFPALHSAIPLSRWASLWSQGRGMPSGTLQTPSRSAFALASKVL